MLIDGFYKVVGFNVNVMVTGNAGRNELMSLSYGELIYVDKG